eukprot:4729854-Prymnesium_polylepis.1
MRFRHFKRLDKGKRERTMGRLGARTRAQNDARGTSGNRDREAQADAAAASMANAASSIPSRRSAWLTHPHQIV